MQELTYNTSELTKQQLIPTKEQSFPPYLPNKDKENVVCKDYDFTDKSLDPAEIASRLIETCKAFHSYSCTSNQVGLNYKLFVAGYDDNFVAYFNPTVVQYGQQEINAADVDTISHPALNLHVKRFNAITIRYQDYEGSEHEFTFTGLTARIIQQSLDRLNGISFTDKVSSLALDRANKALNKRVKKVVRYNMQKVKIKN